MKELMTKEQKAERRAKRQEEQRELEEKFPYAVLSDRNAVLRCEAGYPSWILVRTRSSPSDPWMENYISIANPSYLASFISGLIIRYNALIDDLNKTTESVSIAKAEPIRVED
jgi:hypothetical protein